MEYQKITNLLDDSSNKTSKFRTKNWVEINDESRGTYNDDKQVKFRQPGFTYSACGPFTKTKKRIQKLCLDMFTKMN